MSTELALNVLVYMAAVGLIIKFLQVFVFDAI